jgi:hypothetical protein
MNSLLIVASCRIPFTCFDGLCTLTYRGNILGLILSRYPVHSRLGQNLILPEEFIPYVCQYSFRFKHLFFVDSTFSGSGCWPEIPFFTCYYLW